jgi:hypothetical protein
MSNTPRTDEVTLGEFEYGRDYDGNYQVAALDYEVLRDLARQLERDRARLIEALEQAVSVIKVWHGPEVFDIYFNHSPEMKLIRDMLGTMLPEK